MSGKTDFMRRTIIKAEEEHIRKGTTRLKVTLILNVYAPVSLKSIKSTII